MIRRARLSDAHAVAEVMRDAIRGLPDGAYSARRIARWSSLPALYHAWAMTAGGERYLVAVRRGRVIGYAALRGREVTAAFVSPRAARRGIGTALVRRLEAIARLAGARSLRVAAALPAVPFYAALGYGDRRAMAVPLPEGDALPARLMVKTLAGAHGATRLR